MARNNAPLERDIQRVCIQWLRLWGAVAVRVNSGGFRVDNRFVRANNTPGCSDILCCLPDGRFAAVEVKRRGGKATEQQSEFLRAIDEIGGLSLVVDSLDSLRTQLQRAGYTV